MSRALLAGADGALQAPHVDEVVFLEFDFLSGMSRACTREHSMEWNGVPWLGLGRVGSIEALGEGGELEARGIAMTLSGLTPGLLATALTPSEYKGRAVRMWCGQIEPDIIDFDFTQATLTAQVGAALASIGFTRAGATATRVNAAGLIEVVAADTPRFDYDPVTLACKGLLIEEARTNYLPTFDAGAQWGYGGVTRTANARVSPTGAVNADQLDFAAVPSANAQANALTLPPIANGQTFTYSCYLYAAVPTTVNVQVVSRPSNVQFLSPETTINVVAGWNRFTHTFTIAGITTDTGLGAYLVTRDSIARTIYGWNPQIELGASASSAILTTTAAVTRNQELPSIDNISGFFNASEGALVAEFIASNPVVGGNILVALADGTGANAIVPYFTTGLQGRLYVVNTSVLQADVVDSAFVAGAVARVAIAYKASDVAIATNGSAPSTQASGTIPALNRVIFGAREFNGGQYLNGHLRRFTYYPKRLGNTALQSLSAGADPRSFAVGRRIATSPVGPFLFKMDQLSFQLGQTATIRLTAESRLADWMRPRVRRYNNADHQVLYPADKFFEHTEKQVEAVHLW